MTETLYSDCTNGGHEGLLQYLGEESRPTAGRPQRKGHKLKIAVKVRLLLGSAITKRNVGLWRLSWQGLPLLLMLLLLLPLLLMLLLQRRLWPSTGLAIRMRACMLLSVQLPISHAAVC